MATPKADIRPIRRPAIRRIDPSIGADCIGCLLRTGECQLPIDYIKSPRASSLCAPGIAAGNRIFQNAPKPFLARQDRAPAIGTRWSSHHFGKLLEFFDSV